MPPCIACIADDLARKCELDAPDDYHLTRESDGETTYARRDALELVR